MIAAIPQRAVVTEAPLLDKEAENLETTRVLFMAMDGMTDIEKNDAPFAMFGGLRLPSIEGLRDNNHMVYRCELTPISGYKYIPEPATMIPPEQKTSGKYVSSFAQTVDGVQTEVRGGLESDPEATRDGEFRLKRNNTVLYRKRYAAHDVKRALQRSVPHGVGGLVEITSLKGASAQDIDQAQLFFFPEWNEIKFGEGALPVTTAEMTDHIKDRIEVARRNGNTLYVNIGTEMLKSVSEYQRTSVSTIKADQTMTKGTFEKGHLEAVNSPASELMVAQTGTVRKEDILTAEASTNKELVRELQIDRQARAEREERMLFIEEVKAGIRNPDGTYVGVAAGSAIASTAPVAEDVVETASLATDEEEEMSGIVINVGDTITVMFGDTDREAVVLRKPFGKVTVKYIDDESEETITKDRIK